MTHAIAASADNENDPCAATCCTTIAFPENALRHLRDSYHGLPLPTFLQELIREECQSLDLQLLRNLPGLFVWTEERDFFLRPNFPKYGCGAVDASFHRDWRERFGRLDLIAWHLPPRLWEIDPITAMWLAGRPIHELEEALGTEFLASPYDLTPRHLPALLALRERVLRELTATYGLEGIYRTAFFFGEDDNVPLMRYLSQVPGSVVTRNAPNPFRI